MIRRSLARPVTALRNRLVGAALAAWYRLLRPLYFTSLGRGFYPVGLLRFKHLLPDVRFGRNIHVGPRVTIDVPPGGALVVGDRTTFTGDTMISAAERVEIGDDCIFAEYVSVRDADHGLAPGSLIQYQPMRPKPIRIGNGVWVARGACVLAGSTVGDGAVIGANAVVKGEIPPGAVAVGAPARVIRFRDGRRPGDAQKRDAAT